MKTIFRSLVLLAVMCLPVSAQRPEVGFIRIVNAIAPGEGKATFHLDGRNLFPDGYALGQDTGGYGVKAGNVEVEVRKQGVETGATRISLGSGETMTVIAFAERLPQKNQDDPPRWAIRLLRLRQQEVERGYGLSFISVCKPEEIVLSVTIEGRDRPVRTAVKRLAISKLEVGRSRAEMMVAIGDRPLTHVSPDSPGNYVVILYENADGQIEALSYYDPKFVIAG